MLKKYSSCFSLRCLSGIILLLISVTTVLIFWKVCKTSEFESVVQWMRKNELLAGFLYVLVFACSVVFCCPSTLFEVLAGFIFGFGWGFVVALVGKTIGCSLSFFAGRYLFRDWVYSRLEMRYESFARLSRIIEDNPIKLVFLVRLAFFPISIKNYGLSVLKVQFNIFFAAAVVTGSCFTLLWTYFGHSAENLSDLIDQSTSGKKKVELIVLIAGFSAALILFIAVGVLSKRYVLQMADRPDTSRAMIPKHNDNNLLIEDDDHMQSHLIALPQ